jgi:DNA-directed RNA polymerase subunit H (RpoH/RPB5)
MSSNNQILSIYKSRKNILTILNTLGYETDEYQSFSINEVDAMLSNDQLDMLIENPKTNQKAYIKYFTTSRQIRQGVLDEIIEDLYAIENVLEKKDNLIIIIEDEPNDSIVARLRYLFDHDGIFVVVHNMRRLQFNILDHNLVPTCSVLNTQEKKLFMEKYNVKDDKQLPEISRFDPQALVLCVRPGDVCKFTRKSITALESEYYRICV